MFEALRFWKYSLDVKRLVAERAPDHYADLIRESFAAGLSALQCAEWISLDHDDEDGDRKVEGGDADWDREDAEDDEDNVSEEEIRRDEDITES